MAKKKAARTKRQVGIVDTNPPSAGATTRGADHKPYNTRTRQHPQHERHNNYNQKYHGKGGSKSNNQLQQMIEKDGTKSVIEMAADGNCLFRSLSDQLYHDYGTRHEELRQGVVDFIEAHQDDFAAFLILSEDEDEEDVSSFQHYISTMRQSGEWGGQVELVATGRLYRRKIWVYDSTSLAAYDIPHGSSKPDAGPDLLVSYHDNDHYNSVRDNTRGKPPLPIPTFSIANGARNICEGDEGDESDYEPEEEKVVSDRTSETAPTSEDSRHEPDSSIPNNDSNNNQAAIKKNDPCSCGSGLKYKKCCLARQKHQKRLVRLKNKNDDEEMTDHPSINQAPVEDESTTGNFRVLQI